VQSRIVIASECTLPISASFIRVLLVVGDDANDQNLLRTGALL